MGTSRDIGLKLSISKRLGFFMSGVILAIFNLPGKIPVVRDWFIRIVSIGKIESPINFNSFIEIPSKPILVFGLKFCKIFLTSN
jgi:hypothetical protein